MKKLALTSLLAVFAVSGAHAANVIDNNPLYRPDAGHFYSVTTVGSHSEATDTWALREEFGYGITDKLMVGVATSAMEKDWFDASAWRDFSVGVNYRALDMGNWKADIFGSYALDPVWGNHTPFLDEDFTTYQWTAGVRGGYVAGDWTLAGHVAFDYLNSESFNWGDDGIHKLRVGVDGQLVLCPAWNLVAGVEYTGFLDDDFDNAGRWTGQFGVNYNIDATKFVGAYISGEMAHYTGDWEFEDGFGFGFKFGIDF
ncbi:MAG: hypothetical protein K2L94_02485 [Alphaproteobacteria bacterium]|nr:hypothetical protein [Alphaproteobacteria bacterium]